MSQSYTLVIGGAASGKSAFAEKLITDSGLTRVYLATSQSLDDEMAQKIERHQKMRGAGWRTIEQPLELAEALDQCGDKDALLLDCATMWLSNHMMAGSDLDAAEERLRASLRTCAAMRVVVSNDVGNGIVPGDALSRRFRQAQGELNQRLAADADRVINVIAGLPQVLKGHL